MKFVSTSALILVFLAIAAFAVGCASNPYYVSENTSNIANAILARPDTHITAINGKWDISSGQPFKPPFSCHWWYGVPRPEDYVDRLDCQNGMTKVKVQVKGHPDLYGVMAFNAVWNEGRGLATESYHVDIPDEYLQAAQAGKLTVVYEAYFDEEGSDFASWILWLSTQPLW